MVQPHPKTVPLCDSLLLGADDYLCKPFSMPERVGRIHSRRELIAMAWERDAWPTPRAVDAHIAALRKKLEDSEKAPLIQTVEGEGYRWMPLVDPAP